MPARLADAVQVGVFAAEHLGPELGQDFPGIGGVFLREGTLAEFCAFVLPGQLLRQGEQALRRHRLVDVLHGVKVDGLAEVLLVRIIAEEDDFAVGGDGGDLQGQVHAVHPGHPNVGDQQVRRGGQGLFQGFGAVGGGRNRQLLRQAAAENGRQPVQDVLLVVNQ